MTSLKMVTPLVIMLLTLAFSNISLADEAVKNTPVNSNTGNTISNTDADNDAYPATKMTASHQQKVSNDFLILKQMQKRHREMQQAQQLVFKKHLQKQRQQTIVFNQTQREAYSKLMEDHRILMNEMRDEHRQAAEKRRENMLLKMRKNSTTPTRSTTERASRA